MPKHPSMLTELLGRVSITEVWMALGGESPRRGRSRAFWRNGDGLAVSLDDAKGVWYDFRDGVGGGILDLIQHVRGGTRSDAIRWLVAWAGMPLQPNNGGLGFARDHARRRRGATTEARAFLAWRERLLRALQDYRETVLRALHRARRYIRDHSLDSPLGELAAEVYETCEARLEDLDCRFDLLRRTDQRTLRFLVRRWRDLQRNPEAV